MGRGYQSKEHVAPLGSSQLRCLLSLHDPEGLGDPPHEQWDEAAWEAEVAGWAGPGSTLATDTPSPSPFSLCTNINAGEAETISSGGWDSMGIKWAWHLWPFFLKCSIQGHFSGSLEGQ